MTSNRTIKTPIKRTLIVATTLASMAWMGAAHADEVVRTASAAQTAAVQTTAPVRSFDLRDYGDRFKLAIEAMKKNGQKPDWTWDDSEEDRRLAKTN